MKNTEVQACLLNLKKVESRLIEQMMKTTDLNHKQAFNQAMLTIAEVIEDIKTRLTQIEQQ
ncbi:DUF1657 domain-containing protein [Jeotgalibacillus proteolyticus]|uniref:DUF1657 domain-containing protein n=1 Tax=Jeotgalibacillus proteolyticus TaxID=2082395 RepID=A0A2S5G7E7_9BACL|nr:DUF1657 domain-containing protein [Jeotgalibacillus proteolyticus]PPA68873.1 hypothetical protein C4B60_18315 [Jeotgalibacillus proteolyticus]